MLRRAGRHAVARGAAPPRMSTLLYVMETTYCPAFVMLYVKTLSEEPTCCGTTVTGTDGAPPTAVIDTE